jgi:hypothetical protein
MRKHDAPINEINTQDCDPIATAAKKMHSAAGTGETLHGSCFL